MKYDMIAQGRFLERPNRFVAKVELEGRTETVHVKNTGRCRELLIPGAKVYLEKSQSLNRSTGYDLVAVEKGERIVNIDSQAPNRAAAEWLAAGGLISGITLLRPESVYKSSRFDFYAEAAGERIFIEVKGVTLEEEGIVRFPDAPSERAVKHLGELAAAKREGYRAIVLFVVQMEGARYFTPNTNTHPAFAEALKQAAGEGVELAAYDCKVTPDSMTINRPVPIALCPQEDLLAAVPQPLLAWYDKNRRMLPWREEPAPYRVWVSEIMLQQTRVEAVKPYFERFMRELPDIEALAGAPEEKLLKLWEGLGYYNRARNLQQAARQMEEHYDGKMPQTYGELLKLKGVGSYTAGAVASIAFGECVPAVDGNVLRVLARLRRDERLISESKVKTAVEEELKAIMPVSRPGDFNQALMELGACVCLPNGAPLCGECPLRKLCQAYGQGVQQEYPKKAAKKPRQVEERTILILRDENRAALRKRPSRGLLAGLYEFPSLEGFRTSQEVADYLRSNGIHPLRIQPLEEAKHIFTHREWHMRGYMVRVDELEAASPGEAVRDWIYVSPGETGEKYPIPSAFGAYTKYLHIRLGKERWEEPAQGYQDLSKKYSEE